MTGSSKNAQSKRPYNNKSLSFEPRKKIKNSTPLKPNQRNRA